jgi:Na+/proline symporter
VNSELFIYLLLYFGLLLLVGLLFSKKIKSLEDFFLASRDLSAFLILLTLAGSWLGATSTLVSVDEAFHKGISSFWVIGIPSILTGICTDPYPADPEVTLCDSS